MSDSSILNVAIMGCGLIGTQWDAGATQAHSLTHAAGFSKHPDCRLVALCEHDPAKLAQAASAWQVEHSYTDPQRMFAELAIDIAVVAASTSSRGAVVTPALAAQVKVLVIEKPLAATLAESQQLVRAIDATRTKTIVNYSRHWDPSMRHLRDAIRAGELGTIQRLVGTYGKGLTNNGSHMIDLAAFLLDASPVQARTLGSPLPEHEAQWSNGGDRAQDAQVTFVDRHGISTQLTMLGTDATAFTCFELRVIGTHAIWELRTGGRSITCAATCADPHYPGYTIPATPVSQPARALEAMDNMVHEAVQLARGKIPHSSCDVHTALRTALTVQTILQSAQQNGGWLDIPIERPGYE